MNFLTNAEIPVTLTEKCCPLDKTGTGLLAEAGEKMRLSGRSYFRVLRIARTIADLDKKQNILPKHIAEALRYRPKLD